MDQNGQLTEFEICMLNMPEKFHEAQKKKPVKKKPETEAEIKVE